MRKKLIVLILLLGCFIYGRAEDKVFPAGGYKNIKELRTGQPSLSFDFEVKKRSEEEVRQTGGNEYNVVKPGIPESKKKVWRSCLAISAPEGLFINGKKLGVGLGFSKVLVVGKYLAFKASLLPEHEKEHKYGTGTIGILLEGYYGDYETANEGKTKVQFDFIWALNTETGKKIMLTYGGMTELLEPFPELKKQFMEDAGKDKEEVILQYIRKANNL